MATAMVSRIHVSWRDLYKAAILETKSDAIAAKVAEAETAVLARGREVFYSGSSLEEKEALEDALYILRAYRSARQGSESKCTSTPLEGGEELRTNYCPL